MSFLAIYPESSAYPAEGPPLPASIPEFKFDWWHGDDLVGAFPYHLVTSRLRRSLEHLPDATGFAMEPVRVRRTRFFRASDRARRLPRFWRLVVSGRPCVDDIAATSDSTLVVSGRVLAVLLSHTLEQASLHKYS